ncbi:MAG: hypothetical protein ACYSTL_05490, partial [Planctomycetota bacterium]
AANPADDNAIATDKSALLPAQTATFANYISYSRGINGIMIDIANPGGVPTPTSVTVRAGAGVGGSDRVTLIFGDSDAHNSKWMRITVKATGNTGLVSPDVFYYGLAIGDCGNSTSDARVDAADRLQCRANLNPGFPAPEPVTSKYDFNRDKAVDASDRLIARSYTTWFLNDLELITAP